MNNRKNILAATIGFFAGAGMVSGAMGQEGRSVDVETAGLLEEIVVTATKRNSGIQDTAMSISAISGDTIEKRNLLGMEDFLPSIPGVSMQDRGAGQNNVVIRGISIGSQFDSPTTGVYFGETAITGLGSSAAGDGSGSVDIKLVDIERVEVLKGPQGTLYGAGAMGGTVRVIPNGPKLTDIEGSVSAGFSQTAERGGNNDRILGAVNVPIIEDELAVRAVAYRFDNDGYIDNVTSSYQSETGLLAQSVAGWAADGGVAVDRKEGGTEYSGIRLSALWKPVDELSATLAFLNQEVDQVGFVAVNAGLPGDFERIGFAIDANGQGEFISNEVEIVNLVLEYDIGWATLFSSSSSINYSSDSGFDFTTLGILGVLSAKGKGHADIFSEELRLVSSFDGPFQFLAGLYFEDRTEGKTSEEGPSGTVAVPDPSIAFFDNEQTIEQQSLFGELSYDLNEKLSATLGFRYFEYDQSRSRSRNLGVVRPDEGLSGSVDDTTYKVNFSYSPNDDTLIYAQWAEGFRIGRFQSVIVPERDDPDGNGLINFADGSEREVNLGILEPDTTETYELGLKVGFMDGRATFNSAIFRTDWEGMPLGFRTEFGPTAFFNVGKSEVEGVEFEFHALLSESMSLTIGGSYVESRLSEDAASLGGIEGELLPGSAGFNFGIGLEHLFTIGGYDSFIRADYTYVDEYPHAFKSRIVEGDPVAGGYGLLDVKAGLEIDNISVDVFIDNLTNSNDLTWVDNLLNQFGGGARVYRIKPRTVGMNISYHF